MSVITTGYDINDIRNAVLSFHNTKRATHHAGALSLYAGLNSSAQTHAESMASQDKLVVQPYTVDGQSVGQNIGASYGTNPSTTASSAKARCLDLAQLWYDECSHYDYANGCSNSPYYPIGHFTQVVWKASTKVGVGVAISSQGKLYIATHYLVHGNLVGTFTSNVLAP